LEGKLLIFLNESGGYQKHEDRQSNLLDENMFTSLILPSRLGWEESATPSTA